MTHCLATAKAYGDGPVRAYILAVPLGKATSGMRQRGANSEPKVIW